MFEWLTPIVQPVLTFIDDQYVTNQESQEFGIDATNADASYANAQANQTLAQAQLTAAEDQATFTEDEQRQLLIIIISIIVIGLIGGLFYIFAQPTKS